MKNTLKCLILVIFILPLLISGGRTEYIKKTYIISGIPRYQQHADNKLPLCQATVLQMMLKYYGNKLGVKPELAEFWGANDSSEIVQSKIVDWINKYSGTGMYFSGYNLVGPSGKSGPEYAYNLLLKQYTKIEGVAAKKYTFGWGSHAIKFIRSQIIAGRPMLVACHYNVKRPQANWGHAILVYGVDTYENSEQVDRFYFMDPLPGVSMALDGESAWKDKTYFDSGNWFWGSYVVVVFGNPTQSEREEL